MRNKAVTLIELILALILVSGIITVVSAGLVFFVNQIQTNLERSNIYTQMSYAIEDMNIRCVSAVTLGAYFNPEGEQKSELVLQGENDIYNVTLNILTDNRWYKYYLANPDPDDSLKKDLVVKSCTDSSCSAGSEEILIERKFEPNITFNYDKDTPPNLLRVVLNAFSNKAPLGGSKEITKEGGIRFWFIDAAQ